MLSKILKPRYLRLTKSGQLKFSTEAQVNQKNRESEFSEEEKDYQEKQHQNEFEEEDYEDDFEEEEQEVKKPLWYRITKAICITGILSVFYVNGQIAIKNDFDEQMASNDKFYFFPIYKVSSFFASHFQQGYQYLLYPPLKKFLPDPLPIDPKLMPKTLVLNFEGTMYSKDMKTGDGIVLHLRPGFRKFLKQMAQKYEIVIFSKEDMNFMQEVISTIDPQQMLFPYYFGNEFLAQQVNGKMLKDLKYLNRNPKRTVVIDFDEKVYKNAKYNVLYLQKYKGEQNDDGLKKLSYFLEHLAEPNIRDVRREIKKFGGFQEAVDNYKQDMDDKYQKIKNQNSFFTKKFIGINKRQI